MPYITHVSGQFNISPPLSWKGMREAGFVHRDVRTEYISEYPYGYQDVIAYQSDSFDLELIVEEESIDTEEGPAMRVTARVLRLKEIDEYNSRNLLDHVQQVVSRCPGHTFNGYLYCEGEDNPDMWRVYVIDGKATKVTPEIVWPDIP